jgi:hypothetical protein
MGLFGQSLIVIYLLGNKKGLLDDMPVALIVVWCLLSRDALQSERGDRICDVLCIIALGC